MKVVVLGVAAIGVAIAAACVQPAGQSCQNNLDCGFHDYCDYTLGGQCARWEGRDPSCLSPCGGGTFCSKKQCLPRYSSVAITSPAAGSVVPRTFDVTYVLQEDPNAADSTPIPYTLSAWEPLGPGYHSELGPFDSFEPTVALQGHGSLTLALDASVNLSIEVAETSVFSPPVQIFVDQTRDH